jgi:DNA modification methylase
MVTNLIKKKPFYVTDLGAAYLGDARELLQELPDESVNLIMTSPPYALHFKKEYGNRTTVPSCSQTRWKSRH